MPKGSPFTLDMILNRFSEKGYIVLDKKVEEFGNKTKMNCIDRDGYKYFIHMNSISTGREPLKFHKSNPHSIDNIRNYIIKNNIECEILSEKFVDSNSLLKFRCSCGEIFYKRTKEFMGKNQVKCHNCGRTSTRKLDSDFVRSEFERAGYFWEGGERYISNDTRIKCFDKDGYKVNVSYSSLKGKNRIFSVVSNVENFEFNVNKYVELNSLECSLVGVCYSSKNKDTIIHMKCSCGNLFDVSIDELFVGRNRCQICSHSISKIEFKTMRYLDEMDIKYVAQKRFDDCVNKETGRKLPFDFYIPSKNLCVECDGYQHFYKSGLWDKDPTKGLQYRQKLDKIKDEYCLNKNMELLRIHFKHYKKDKYKEIILNKIR